MENVAKEWVMGFALLHKVAKVEKGWVVGFALFAPSGKSGKKMGYRICTFCTKWQKDGL